MDKEKILSEIKQRLGKTSLSDRTIEVCAEQIPLAEGTEPDDGYWNSVISMLQALQGQYNNMAAEFMRQHGGGEKGGGGDNEAVLKQLNEIKEEYTKLVERLDASDRQKSRAELLDEVKRRMEAAGCDRPYVLKQTLKGAHLDPEKDVETLVEEQLKRYDAEVTEAYGDGAKPRDGGGGGGEAKTAAAGYFATQKKWKEF